MSKKDSYQLRLRRAAILRTFDSHLRSGCRRMDAYARTADEFYLSEERIRQIIAGRD